MNGTGTYTMRETVDLHCGIGRQLLPGSPAKEPALRAVYLSGRVIQEAHQSRSDGGMLGTLRQLALAGF